MTDGEKRAFLKVVRALLAYGRAGRGPEYDFDVEEALEAAKEHGIDIESEKKRAWDASNIPVHEFDKKWGKE